jgi:hypothetical protein
MPGTCATQGNRRGGYRILVGKPDITRRLEIRRCRWEYNIKTDLKERDEGAWTELIWFKTETSLQVL